MYNNLLEICKLDHGKILFAGIGNVLKNDDGVGVFISRHIRNTGNIMSLTVEVSIENYIGKINKIKPDILILIDCVDMKLCPGSYKLLALDQVMDMTFNTHNISLKRLSEFFPVLTFVLGIQPQNLGFGETISSPVLNTANSIIDLINNKEVHYDCPISMPCMQGSIKS
jgi:hydrogenase 3 maturation protease